MNAVLQLSSVIENPRFELVQRLIVLRRTFNDAPAYLQLEQNRAWTSVYNGSKLYFTGLYNVLPKLLRQEPRQTAACNIWVFVTLGIRIYP
eukprot:6466159-Amphidinium_carterae.2